MADNVIPMRNTQKRQQSDKAMNRALAAYQMGIEKCQAHDLKFEVAVLTDVHRMLEGLAKYGDEESEVSARRLQDRAMLGSSSLRTGRGVQVLSAAHASQGRNPG